jgi:hypothetical protein
MGLVIVNLSEIPQEVKGDLKIVLSELSSRVKKLSLSELDTKYGGESWCTKIQASLILKPPSVSIQLDISDSYDFGTLSLDVQKTFEKNWAALINTILYEEQNETSKLNGNGSIQEMSLDGISYFLFDNFQYFTREIQKSKKAILKTNFSSIKNHLSEFFKFIAERFGTESEELHAVMRSELFCASCLAHYNPKVLMLLRMPYQNMNPPTKCPKCNSDEILYFYRADTTVKEIS